LFLWTLIIGSSSWCYLVPVCIFRLSFFRRTFRIQLHSGFLSTTHLVTHLLGQTPLQLIKDLCYSSMSFIPFQCFMHFWRASLFLYSFALRMMSIILHFPSLLVQSGQSPSLDTCHQHFQQHYGIFCAFMHTVMTPLRILPFWQPCGCL